MIRSSFVFKGHLVFNKEDNPLEKYFVVEEELDGIDIDDIRNLVDLPRLLFIEEECKSLIVVVYGG